MNRISKHWKKIITAGFLVSLLFGCQIDEQWLKKAEKSPLRASCSAGAVCSFALPPIFSAQINEWLKNHQTKWVPDVNSYVPETVIENDFIRLNIQQTRLILSIKKDDKWTQFSRGVDAESLSWKDRIESMHRSEQELGNSR